MLCGIIAYTNFRAHGTARRTIMAENDFATAQNYQGTPGLNRVMPQNIDAERAVHALD